MEAIRRYGTVLALTMTAQASLNASPGLTIYNQGFAVVRDTVPLDLKAGANEIRFTDTTAHLEPDSVILRDPAGKHRLQIIEQNFRGDPLSEGLLLAQYEGKVIDFLVARQGQPPEIVKGKLIRAPYVVHPTGLRRYGQEYYQTQMARAQWGTVENSPIVEVNGQLRFSLPGQPIFPPLTDDAVLKPTLDWILETDAAGKFDAELAYVTGGMSWEADYNLVSPADSDTLDIVGWVTMDNQSGRTFENARIKLMAGDVNKLRRDDSISFLRSGGGAGGPPPPVTEQAFDEYHLYTLERPSTLHDRETKQVEFVRAGGVPSQRIYVYDGAKIDRQRYQGYSMESIRDRSDYGTECNPKVWAMKEFVNSTANHLGIPLPRGQLRFYRRGDDGLLEFTGENIIDHTPVDEKIRVYTGNAFDVVGERRRTGFRRSDQHNAIDESFEIKLRNHKKEPTVVRVVEHLYRWYTWEVTEKSLPFEKLDSQTIEFRANLLPDGEATITYDVHYSW